MSISIHVPDADSQPNSIPHVVVAATSQAPVQHVDLVPAGRTYFLLSLSDFKEQGLDGCPEEDTSKGGGGNRREVCVHDHPGCFPQIGRSYLWRFAQHCLHAT